MGIDGSKFTINHGPIVACIRDMNASALDVVQATNIPLPKVLRLMGLSKSKRERDALDGLELVQLCIYVGLPLSAVIKREEA